MATDPLEQVLRLVSEGRLTADEAAPILAALDAAGEGPAAVAGEPTTVDAIRDQAAESLGAFARSPGDGAGPDAASTMRRGPASSLRIEVRDAGRSVVNLRLPLAVGRFALDRVPGLSGDQVARVREAMNSGFKGPVLVVDDDGDGVRISIE